MATFTFKTVEVWESVCFVEAKNEEEARKKILKAYSKEDNEDFFEFEYSEKLSFGIDFNSIKKV